MEYVEIDDGRVREADLNGHLDVQPGQEASSSMGLTVSADDDFPLYEAINLMKSAHVLARKNP